MMANTAQRLRARTRNVTLPVIRRSVRTRSTLMDSLGDSTGDSFIPHRRLLVFPAGNAARRKCFVGYARCDRPRNPAKLTKPNGVLPQLCGNRPDVNSPHRKTGRNARAGVPIMMTILYRPMVKEALVLISSGALATMICSRVYAAPLPDAEPAAPAVSIATAAPAPQYQLAPMSKEEGRQMLLSALHGQVPLASPTLTANR